MDKKKFSRWFLFSATLVVALLTTGLVILVMRNGEDIAVYLPGVVIINVVGMGGTWLIVDSLAVNIPNQELASGSNVFYLLAGIVFVISIFVGVSMNFDPRTILGVTYMIILSIYLFFIALYVSYLKKAKRIAATKDSGGAEDGG